VSEPARAARLGPGCEPPIPGEAGSRHHDSWLDREVLVLPLDELTRARAAAFARADHPALPTVMRLDADAAEIWIAPARGTAVRGSTAELADQERSRLAQAVAALHRAGGVHGCIDADHVFRDAGAVRLGWPSR
jgi:serine/threonine-protein kinase